MATKTKQESPYWAMVLRSIHDLEPTNKDPLPPPRRAANLIPRRPSGTTPRRAA